MFHPHYPDDYEYVAKGAALVGAVSRGKIDVVRQCLDEGADLHYGDDNALRVAAITGNMTLVRFLVEKGANVNAANEQSLLSATRRHDVEMFEYLVSKGASIPDMLRLNAEISDQAALKMVDRIHSERSHKAFVENMEALKKVASTGKGFVLKPRVPNPPTHQI